MLRLKPIVATLSVMTLVVASAIAGDDPKVPGAPPAPRAKLGKGGAPALGKLDTNKDGQISRPEFEKLARKAAEKRPAGKAGAKNGAKIFDRLDTDKNGSLSPMEIEKIKQLRARKKGSSRP